MSKESAIQEDERTVRLQALGYGTWRAPEGFAAQVIQRHKAQAERPRGGAIRQRSLRLAALMTVMLVGTAAIARYVGGDYFWFHFGAKDPGVVASMVNDEHGQPLVPDSHWSPSEPVRNIADVFATFDRGVQEGVNTVEVSHDRLESLGAGAPDGAAGIMPPNGLDRRVDIYTFRRKSDGGFVGRIAAEPDTRVWLGALWAR